MYRFAYYPHNIHFVMVSAQMGGDGATAIAAAEKLDRSMPVDVVARFPSIQPVKAAPYTTHAQFSAPETILALPAPPEGLVLVEAMYHYARAVAFALPQRCRVRARAEIGALARIEAQADFAPFAEWNVPAKEVVQTAKLTATARALEEQLVEAQRTGQSQASLAKRLREAQHDALPMGRISSEGPGERLITAHFNRRCIHRLLPKPMIGRKTFTSRMADFENPMYVSILGMPVLKPWTHPPRGYSPPGGDHTQNPPDGSSQVVELGQFSHPCGQHPGQITLRCWSMLYRAKFLHPSR